MRFKAGERPRDIFPITQFMVRSKIFAMEHPPRWADCSKVFRQLSSERAALRALSKGNDDSVPVDSLVVLRKHELIAWDGKSYALTSNGRAMVFFC